MKIEARESCNQCEIMYINGVRCHETVCPKAWTDEIRECLWCGNEFLPDSKYQEVCTESCAEAYFGY